jgi:hypothetical protein
MQQFTVPQFIDVEDKVIGPLSVRQFIIMLADFGLVFAAYKLFDFSLFLFSSIIIVVVGFTFAFIKINGAPFHYFLLNLLQTFKRKNLRVWNKVDLKEEIDIIPIYKDEGPLRPEVTGSRLSRLALVADTKGYYSGEEDQSSTISINREKNIDDLLK